MTDKPIQTYDDVMEFLLEFTDYEKVTKYKYNIATFDLGRVEELLAAVGNPHRAFPSVHIAGTKGKGSTASMVQSILVTAGLCTGLFTSPHLCRLEERMTVEGQLMTERELVDIVNELVPYTRKARTEKPNESPTFFELVTAIGFRHFARRKVDFGVVEVGMGGRLDATNVITPEVCVITHVDLDHVERLGHTLGQIAREKAGIIKSNVPVVCAPQGADALDTISRVANERGAPMTRVGRDYLVECVETGLGPVGKDSGKPFCRFDLIGPKRRYEGLTVALLGEHQALNAACAVAAVELLEQRCDLALGERVIRRGLASARCPARLEFFAGHPPVLLDGAHNPASIRVLCRTVVATFPNRRVVLVMGVSRDKDIPEMLKIVLPLADAVIFSQSSSPRAELPDVLAETARDTHGIEAEVERDPSRALARANVLAGPRGLVCVTGSFYLAGEIRPTLVAAKSAHR